MAPGAGKGTGSKAKKKKKKKGGSVASTFTFTALETHPSWFDDQQFVHVHCSMLGMEALVVDLGVCSTSMTVAELKLTLRNKFESLLGDFTIYSPRPPAPQQGYNFGGGSDSFSRSSRGPSRLSSIGSDILSASSSSSSLSSSAHGAATGAGWNVDEESTARMRARSSTMPNNNRPASLTRRDEAKEAVRKASTMVMDDGMKLGQIGNVKWSATRESAPKVRLCV